MNKLSSFPLHSDRRGAALVVVLSMVVLLTVLILAFFSKATLQHQVSSSYVNQLKVQTLADGALSQIMGDLKQEIIFGSVISAVPATSIELYRPLTPTANRPNAIPQPVIPGASATTAGLENLVKISTCAAPFFDGSSSATSVPARACNSPTTSTSRNGRAVTRARWNRSLLLSKNTPASTDVTPVGTFPTPDWVLVARNGSNPAAVSRDVVGRYAFAIYNEGGLLDANAAGFPSVAAGPSASPAGQTALKTSLAYADLTIPEIGLSPGQVDQLVNWRNEATFGGTAGSLSFFNWATWNPMQFLSPANQTLRNGNSDRLFLTRQQLIDFFTRKLTGNMADLQNTLRNFGAFSRTLNQPTLWPYWTETDAPNDWTSRSKRPKVVSTAAASGTGDMIGYGGGNNAYDADEFYNPAFQTVRVDSDWTQPRNDGTLAKIGEPLVKKRFALNRLCWITYKGPSASLSASDPSYLVYTANGATPELLAAGTPENILKYFGLTWTAGPPEAGGVGGFWTYNHGVTLPGGGTFLASLSDPASSATPRDVLSAKREPDFFELLKATINAGSLGKGWPSIGSTDFQFRQDTNVIYHLFQIGANIIDQVNPTQFPTHILYYESGASGYRHVFGSTDLPGLAYDHNITMPLQAPNPAPANSDLRPEGRTSPLTSSYSAGFYSAEEGTAATFVVPTIWNPYSMADSGSAVAGPVNLRICMTNQNAALNLVSPSSWPSPGGWLLSTTRFRMNARANYKLPVMESSTELVGIRNDSVNATTNVAAKNYSNFFSNWSSQTSTSFTFNNVSSLYREPTVLFRPGIPTGSNLALQSGNAMAAINASWQTGIPEPWSGERFIGALVNTTPIRWTVASDGTAAPPTKKTYPYYIYTGNFMSINTINGGSTWRLEYQPPGSTSWIPCKEYPVKGNNSPMGIPQRIDGTASAPSILLPNGSSLWNGQNPTAIMSNGVNGAGAPNTPQPATFAQGFLDPRSNRFGGWGDVTLPAFLNQAVDMVNTERPAAAKGASTHSTTATGWYTSTPSQGLCPGMLSQNHFNSTWFYCWDADGLARRAMGGFAGSTTSPIPSNTYGLPLATAYPTVPASGSAPNRPVILHRPFRSVAELAHVFSDTPWKNLDFFAPESGCGGLLDVFCISDSASEPLMAGRVDLNTRNEAVLKSILRGSARDSSLSLSAAETSSIVNAIRTRVESTSPGQGPFFNISDLVGRWKKGRTFATTGTSSGCDATPLFDGIAADPALTGTLAEDIIARKRKASAAIRALAGSTQAGTWNLLIDIVAQTGRYPAGATVGLNDFIVEGERRCWVHLAIDRQTARVIDQQVEIVNE